MSAEKTAEEKKRRRRSRKNAEPVDEVEADEVEAEEQGVVTERKGRATPGRRVQSDSRKSGGNAITRAVGGMQGYFEGVRSELQKVTWPTREDIQRLTVIVVVTTVSASIFLGGLSFIFTEVFRRGLADPAILAVLLVVLLGLVGGYLIRSGRSGSSSF